MRFKNFLVLGFILTALGIGLPIFTGIPGPYLNTAEAAVISITNTCTGTFQAIGRPRVLSGSDTAEGILAPAQRPVSWISSVVVNLKPGETGILITLSSDTPVDTFCLVKIRPDGSPETKILLTNTCLDTGIISDTTYYYSVFAIRTGMDTGLVSDSVAIGVSPNGIIFSPGISDSTSIELISAEDSRVTILIEKPGSSFAGEGDMLILVINKLTLTGLPVPSWAKQDVVNPYEAYVMSLRTGRRISQLACPIELTFAYDIERNKVKGTGITEEEILNRLSNFRWTGEGWTRLFSIIDLAGRTVASQTDHLSYFAICDVKTQQAPGFPYYGSGPNPFSPNSDGYNDAVYFRFPKAEEAGVLEIYDLRGAVVYREEIPLGKDWVKWDGYYSQSATGRTELADSGAYIWQVKIGRNVYRGAVVIAK